MALSNDQKAAIRRFLGYSAFYTQVNAELEGQFNAFASLTDGDATLNNIGTVLTKLAGVETRIERLLDDLPADKVDELRVDSVRARAALCAEGRRLVTSLEVLFNLKRRVDVFSGRS